MTRPIQRLAERIGVTYAELLNMTLSEVLKCRSQR